MKSGKSGKTTKKSGPGFNWAKLVIVMVCVAFAGIMIITSLGSSWLVSMKPARSGDAALIGITIRDDQGRPVLTTDEKLYTDKSGEGDLVFISKPLTFRANSTSSNLIEKIPAYNYNLGNVYFGLYNPEFNKISADLVGMKQGQTKRITFDQNLGLEWTITEEEFNSFGGNFSQVHVGDQLALTIMDSPAVNLDDNTTAVMPLRIAQITAKNATDLKVSLEYSTADITIQRLSSSS
jgi:hypothetical protein